MHKVFVLRPASEIYLKTSFVRQFFLKKLVYNLKTVLKKNNIDLKTAEKFSGLIICKTSNNEKAAGLMKKVFGLHSFSLAEPYSFSSLKDLEEIFLVFAEKNLFKGDVFALKISRNGKHDFSSHDAAVACGQKIMDAIPGISVNLSFPSKTIFADIINNKVFLFTEKVPAAKGLPVGVEGKVGVLMQGKEEELISSFLMLKRGCNIFPVIKEMNPEIKKNLKMLSLWNSFQEFKPILLSEIEKEKAFLSALILSETKLEQIKNSLELQDQTGFVVFFPLVFYPENLYNEILLKVKE
jgi:thiamine biosynthesis protein ThiI